MNYLSDDDVYEGSIVPIYVDNKIEGYALLLNEDGEKLTFMEKENPNDDDGVIYIKQRWLIEWVSLDQVPVKLNNSESLTQRFLAGNKTHRHIIYYGADSWEEYSYIHGGLKEKNYYQRTGEVFPKDNNFLM